MRTIKLVKLARLAVLLTFMSIGVLFLSCSPDPITCEDCYTVTNYEDGSTSTYCVEYDCADPNY